MQRSALAASVLLTSLACSTPPSNAINLAAVHIVDLTHAFNEQTIYWPTSTETFRHDSLAWGMTPGGWFYSSFGLSTPEHGGTHLDAPIHFADGAQEIPLAKLIVPAVVIDVSGRATEGYLLTRDDVLAFEAEYGTIEPAAPEIQQDAAGGRETQSLRAAESIH